MSCAGDGGLLAATCGASASRVTSWQRGRPFTTGEKENGGKWITTKNGRRVMKLSLTKQGRQRYWRAPRPRPRPHRRQRRNVVKEIVQSALSPAETGAAANSKDSAQVIMALQTSLCCVSPHILILWDYLLINVSPSVIYFLSVAYTRQSVVLRGIIIY